MRVAPLGAYFAEDVERAASEAHLSAQVTHAHPEGQAGAIAAPQTIISAVLDALAPLGIDHIDMPATPERVWRAIRAAR